MERNTAIIITLANISKTAYEQPAKPSS